MEYYNLIPKELASRIRGAQEKVLNARQSVRATEYNSIQDEARWEEFVRDPDAFAQKHYPGYSFDSYPVQTNISKVKEKLDRLPARRERNKNKLKEADDVLLAVEADVKEKVSRMKTSNGRVPWPSPLESYAHFYEKVMIDACHQRDTSDEQREHYFKVLQDRYDSELADMEIMRQAEMYELKEEMKLWTSSQKARFREIIGGVLDGLRDRTLTLDGIDDFLAERVRQVR